jgi:hypothetical protein
MNKIVSYNEFLKHKADLTNYLDDLFNKIPDLTVYFPNTLTRDDRHTIYVNSKGYLFEKLNKVGSKYSIKLWKEQFESAPTEEEEEEEEDEEVDETNVQLATLCETVIDTSKDMLREIVNCRLSINRVECMITFMTTFNFFGVLLFLLNTVDPVEHYSNFSRFGEII